jgi:hypothetical protein
MNRIVYTNLCIEELLDGKHMQTGERREVVDSCWQGF